MITSLTTLIINTYIEYNILIYSDNYVNKKLIKQKMAITIINNPNPINSSYNPNQWIIDSNNKSQLGFRYVVNVYNATTNTLIKKFTTLPRPGDGYGEFDLSKLLQDYLDINFTQNNINSISFDADNYYFDYNIKFGEEYIVNWSYTDTEWINYEETKCVSTITPTFVPGDTVVVIPTNPSIRPTFQGLYNVIHVDTINNWVSFNTPWLSTGLNPGIIRYADNRKTEFLEGSFTSDFRVIKSVIPFNIWNKNYVSNNYFTYTNTNKLLTNFKNNYYINESQDLFIPFYCNSDCYVKFETSTTETYTELIGINAFKFVNVTPHFQLPTSGEYLFTTDLKWYDVSIINSNGDSLTEKIRINVIRNCPVDDISILFEDRMGSLTSFAFDAMNNKNVNVTKEVYNKPININNNIYDSSNTSGIKTSSINYDDTITLRTKTILNREQDQYFEELITTGNAWIKINGEYQRINILTTSINVLNKKQTGLRRREIQIQLANKNKINY